MNDIRRVLRLAAWRIFLTDFVRTFIICACAAMTALILLRLAQQMFAFEVRWTMAAWIAGGAALVSAIAWRLMRLANRQAVARRVDEGAELREAISTALCCAGSDDPWAKATVEDASQRARSINVAKAVPLAAPRFWPAPLAMGIAFAIIYMAVPSWDLLGRRAVALEETKKENAVLEAKAQADAVQRKVEEVASKLELKQEPADEGAEPGKPEQKDPEQIRRTAIKKLTSLKDQLEDMKQSGKGQSMDAVKDAMKQLKTPGEGELTKLSQMVANSDFSAAKDELKQLQDKLSAGKLSEKDKEKLAEQLKDLGKQLEKLADDKKDLEKKLEKAGLDKKLAMDPEKLKEALKNMEGMSEEQKKQIQQMAESMGKCSKMCQGLGEQCQKAGSAMKEGKGEQEGLDDLGEKLSELQQLADEMKMADAALKECEGQLEALQSFCKGGGEGLGECEGGLKNMTSPWAAGTPKNNMGSGRGGPGTSAGGGRPGEQDGDIKMKKEKAKSPLQGGPIVSSRLVQGEQIKGQSTAEFEEAMSSAEQAASEALENNQFPRELHDPMKHYFGTLKAKVVAKSAGGSTTPAPAPAPKKQ